jgi:hypothetical protein
MALSKTTQDHEEIRRWAEARSAVPAEVANTHQKNEPGILRFCFPDAPNRKDSNLREISWEEFFEKFDENNMELVYQEKTAAGEESNFNKLIHPESDEHSRNKKSSGGSKSSGSSSRSKKESTTTNVSKKKGKAA